MIIFYEPTTGIIRGTVDGRIHSDDHFKMDCKGCMRLIFQYRGVKWYDKTGNVVDPETQKDSIYAADFEPFLMSLRNKEDPTSMDHYTPLEEQQKELIMKFDSRTANVYDYKVDLETKSLVPKDGI